MLLALREISQDNIPGDQDRIRRIVPQDIKDRLRIAVMEVRKDRQALAGKAVGAGRRAVGINEIRSLCQSQSPSNYFFIFTFRTLLHGDS